MNATTYPPLTEQQFTEGCGFTYRGVPICEDENADYVYAWGHVKPSKFVKVLHDFDTEMIGSSAEPYLTSDVKHVWAVTIQPPDGPEGWWVAWSLDGNVAVTAETPGAFAMTVVDR